MSNKNKKVNLIPLIISFLLIGIFVYIVKPNKLLTYARSKFGIKNKILIYELNKQSPDYKQKKQKLAQFLIERGISGTAYENKNMEYYVTLIPITVNPKSELNFGFKPISPEEFYKKVYNTKQVYFTRTLKIIE